MRRITWVLAIIMSVALVLAGCGKKDAASVVKDLNNVSDKLESKQGAYQGSGTMTLYTGEQPQEYKVEVWYKNPSYYRISLSNVQKDVTQIVLRNDEGVFVLTPSLGKSFRFQSDWPDNQGQVYLYQTLLRGIVSDNNRQFVEDGDNYVFEVAANYQSSALVRQKIWLAKKTYEPKQVQVSDSEAKVVVNVKFDSFKFDPEFTKDSFDMQKNMATGSAAESTLAEVDENGNPVAAPENARQEDQTAAAEPGDFGIIEPGYIPAGVQLKDSNKLEDSKDHSVLLRYDGTYQYTIIESRPLDRAVSLAPATLIDLGFTAGALTGDEQKTLTWMSDGVQYRITSANLPVSEMMQIAASMEEQSGK
ncbi:outer membrane lipoprotein carrier protein LolA [Paenibacillus sonchi]|uniref:Outer membrane lipoprotein carrier protein LolA n=1 Tax=Paenibacillus sonchi TaxID=373687 RepID=A0A974PHK4_9BACL|nr:outer membrane lipoprotein carrier protein LolA [Paenibacillus sonchi]QQZ63636.1 outer membrane lipoprotein carrier protein LolA [Paenibacillus sonchi]